MISTVPYRHSARWIVTWLFVAVALVCIAFADIRISSLDPWTELQRIFRGLLSPAIGNGAELLSALAHTVAFAILGVYSGALFGFGLALVFHLRVVRVICALLRSVHELFWALIFLQIFGLHPLTGLLALGIPYAATFAKIYAEILEEGSQQAVDVLNPRAGKVSLFFYARLPDLWQHFKTYTAYRLECGLRASAVLGFIGLPTLGYNLSTAFLEGQYSQVWVVLGVFYLLIATMKYWLRAQLLPLYLIAAPFVIHNEAVISFANVKRFFLHDIIPAPIRNGESLGAFFDWIWLVLVKQAVPGLINTLLLSQIALVATGLVALLAFPLISRWFVGTVGHTIGHAILVMLRSTPEYMLAFILLLLWGPSMLPAIVALALHNGAIIAHLIGRYSNQLSMREDASSGLNSYGYELLPRVYGQFLAFLFYRWEVIFRETAILGVLGIATLGFYIDSALQDIRLDRAMVLILITALMSLLIDTVSRKIRSHLRLNTTGRIS